MKKQRKYDKPVKLRLISCFQSFLKVGISQENGINWEMSRNLKEINISSALVKTFKLVIRKTNGFNNLNEIHITRKTLF